MSSSMQSPVGSPRIVARGLTPDESAARKLEAQGLILEKLKQSGEIHGSIDELRAQLRLYDMSNRLFKDACNGLRYADQSQGEPKVLFKPLGDKKSPQQMQLKLL